VEIDGRVRIGKTGGVSKSANPHQAFLETDGGQRYRLRRRGGNPMRDLALERLDGERVRVDGDLLGDDLLMARSIVREREAKSER
jgi:hypothetical protein